MANRARRGADVGEVTGGDGVGRRLGRGRGPRPRGEGEDRGSHAPDLHSAVQSAERRARGKALYRAVQDRIAARDHNLRSHVRRVLRQHDQGPGGQHRRVHRGVPGTEEEPERRHDADDGLVPPRDTQGSPEVERLLADVASARVPYVCSPVDADGSHDMACADGSGIGAAASPENVSLVARSSPGPGCPRPTSVNAGTRRPRPGAYQPRMGSVSPRCRLHCSCGGSSSRPRPAAGPRGQRRTARASSSSASTSGPQWKARRRS